jgi:outer membrane protein
MITIDHSGKQPAANDPCRAFRFSEAGKAALPIYTRLNCCRPDLFTMLFPRLLAALLVAIAVSCRPAVAGQGVTEIPFFNSPPGSAALGGGLRFGQDLYRAADNDDQRQLDLVPLYLYNGKWLFARGAMGGLHFINRENFEFNLVGRYRFQKLDPDRNAYFEGLNKREQTVETGLEVRLDGAWGAVDLNLLTDALNRHEGQTADISYRYDIDRGRFTFSPFVSWIWQDDTMTDYYYGVSEEEARPDRPAYEAGDSQWLLFGLNSTFWVSDRIAFFANMGFGGLSDEVTDSPLVEEDGGSVVFMGGTYVFGNTRRPTAYITPERASEWSWRVNYGYQADGNIFSEIDQGEFQKSEFADTRIAGLTLSKLLSDGPRVDFVGNLALFRHLEEDEGNGRFNSYAAYIMARGKGYGRWSKEEWFRWGFGFGMSYADRVPIAEQRKQAAKGNNTSHFLNYLEMQLDFPLRRLFKGKPWEDCYAGLTVVHRSGIFATSDILGDVAGGADWITAHLECTRW